jgi:hypothetical protein
MTEEGCRTNFGEGTTRHPEHMSKITFLSRGRTLGQQQQENRTPSPQPFRTPLQKGVDTARGDDDNDGEVLLRVPNPRAAAA